MIVSVMQQLYVLIVNCSEWVICELRTDWKLSILPKALQRSFWAASIILSLGQASLVINFFWLHFLNNKTHFSTKTLDSLLQKMIRQLISSTLCIWHTTNIFLFTKLHACVAMAFLPPGRFKFSLHTFHVAAAGQRCEHLLHPVELCSRSISPPIHSKTFIPSL